MWERTVEVLVFSFLPMQILRSGAEIAHNLLRFYQYSKLIKLHVRPNFHNGDNRWIYFVRVNISAFRYGLL